MVFFVSVVAYQLAENGFDLGKNNGTENVGLTVVELLVGGFIILVTYRRIQEVKAVTQNPRQRLPAFTF